MLNRTTLALILAQDISNKINKKLNNLTTQFYRTKLLEFGGLNVKVYL